MKEITSLNRAYRSLLSYTNYLLEIINSLPYVDEIRNAREYKKLYNKFCKDSAKYLDIKYEIMSKQRRK